jgi:hypothetical protein
MPTKARLHIAVVVCAEFVGNSPSEFRAFVDSEVTRWGEVGRKAGLKPES